MVSSFREALSMHSPPKAQRLSPRSLPVVSLDNRPFSVMRRAWISLPCPLLFLYLYLQLLNFQFPYLIAIGHLALAIADSTCMKLIISWYHSVFDPSSHLPETHWHSWLCSYIPHIHYTCGYTTRLNIISNSRSAFPHPSCHFLLQAIFTTSWNYLRASIQHFCH